SRTAVLRGRAQVPVCVARERGHTLRAAREPGPGERDRGSGATLVIARRPRPVPRARHRAEPRRPVRVSGHAGGILPRARPPPCAIAFSASERSQLRKSHTAPRKSPPAVSRVSAAYHRRQGEREEPDPAPPCDPFWRSQLPEEPDRAEPRAATRRKGGPGSL